MEKKPQKTRLMMRRSDEPTAPVTVNHNSCDGCGVCAEVCPTDVFEMKDITDEQIRSLSFFGRLKVRVKGKKKSYVVSPDACIACGTCVKQCHERAISLHE